MRTTIRLPEELLERAKRKAAADGKTLTALIEEGLRAVLAGGRRRPASKPERPPMPISKRTGGLMPGIDPIKFRTQLEEEDDLEMLRRTSAST